MAPTDCKVKFRADGQFDGWCGIMFGICLDWGVVRSGRDGVERAVELDVALGLWSFCLSWYWTVTPRRHDEHFLDTLLRHQERDTEVSDA